MERPPPNKSRTPQGSSFISDQSKTIWSLFTGIQNSTMAQIIAIAASESEANGLVPPKSRPLNTPPKDHRRIAEQKTIRTIISPLPIGPNLFNSD